MTERASKECTCKARSGIQVGGGNGMLLFQHTRGGTIPPCFGYFTMKVRG